MINRYNQQAIKGENKTTKKHDVMNALGEDQPANRQPLSHVGLSPISPFSPTRGSMQGWKDPETHWECWCTDASEVRKRTLYSKFLKESFKAFTNPHHLPLNYFVKSRLMATAAYFKLSKWHSSHVNGQHHHLCCECNRIIFRIFFITPSECKMAW